MTPHVAFGPISTAQSWAWVGEALALELGRTGWKTSMFHGREEPDDAHVWVFVKARPTEEVVRTAQRLGIRTVYAPIDYYEDERDLRTDALLPEFDLVLAHSEALVPHLAHRCRRVERIEHHVKHGLDTIRPWRERKPTDRIAWIGHTSNLQSLFDWLDDNDDGRRIQKILTLVTEAKRDLGNQFPMARRMKTLTWSESMHRNVLEKSIAILDIKGNDFQQRMKPPTKAQQYVWSGIPLAMNLDSGPAHWMRLEGLKLADPRDEAMWFSKAYWEKTSVMAQKLRGLLSLERIGARVAALLAELVGAPT